MLYNKCLNNFFIIVLLFCFALLCYYPILSTYFLSDDFYLIGQAVERGMFFAWGTEHGGFFRPIIILSYIIDHLIWGLNPVGYHLTNIIFHTFSAYGVFLLAKHFIFQMQKTKKIMTPLFGACLFIALPCHSESVSWISGRTDIIATTFGLFSTALFISLLQRYSFRKLVLHLAFFLAALLSKESIIILPIVWIFLLLHDCYVTKRQLVKKSFIPILISFFILIIYFIFRKQVIGHFVGGYGTERHLSLINKSTIFNAIFYLFRTLSPALPHHFNKFVNVVIYSFSSLLCILLSVMLFKWRKFFTVRGSLILLFIVCYFVCLVPVITLNISLFDTQSERFLYLPSVFACLLASCLFAYSLLKTKHVIFLFSALIILYVLVLYWVNGRWVTASHLSKQLAEKVSLLNPEKTVLVNIPDNFLGAYIFRNGLQEAATIFQGKNNTLPYHTISKHGLTSVEEKINIYAQGSNIIIPISPERHFYSINTKRFNVKKDKNALVVGSTEKNNLTLFSIFSFEFDCGQPVLRRINL